MAEEYWVLLAASKEAPVHVEVPIVRVTGTEDVEANEAIEDCIIIIMHFHGNIYCLNTEAREIFPCIFQICNELRFLISTETLH